MRTIFVSVLLLCIASIYGRSVQNEEATRALKGVLKFYKDQPRITDSESLEFEEPDPFRADAPVIRDDELERLQQKIAVKSVPEQNIGSLDSDSDARIETTIVPIVENEVGSSSNQHLSKSDLYADEHEMDDIDDCVEGDVMKVSCNTCVCSDGKYFCSKKDCHDKPNPLPPLEKASSKRKGGPIKYHSVKGVDPALRTPSNAVTNASSAVSSEDAQPGNATVPFIVEEVDSSQCVDGRTKPVDCNQCVCAMGQWACTKMSCIALTLREKASYSGSEFLKSVAKLKEQPNYDEDCMEGEAKQKGCNQCVCHMNSWACSDFSCPSTPAPPKVEVVQETCQTEEDVKSKDCNICSCRRGLWVCTQNDCKKFGNRYFNPVHSKHNSDENEHEV